MHICCLDLEGVLLPEIWIHLAKKFKIDDLFLTTRDIANYDELMGIRLKVLKRHKITLPKMQKYIKEIEPLKGAKTFIKKLEAKYPVIILSDTFYEFVEPLMPKLGSPTLFCHQLKVDQSGYITGYKLRKREGKKSTVVALQKEGFHVRVAGDSFNDLSMIQAADKGFFFKPTKEFSEKYPEIKTITNYDQLYRSLTS